MLLFSENQPMPVFATPVVTLERAFCPSAVLNPGRGVACVLCGSAKKPSAKSIVVIMLFRFCIVYFLSLFSLFTDC